MKCNLKSEILTCRRSSKNWNLVSRSVIRPCLRVVSAWLTCSRLSTPFSFWSMLMSISCLSKSISARGSSTPYGSHPCTMMLLTPSAPDPDTCMDRAVGVMDPKEHSGIPRHMCTCPCCVWIMIKKQTMPAYRLPRKPLFSEVKGLCLVCMMLHYDFQNAVLVRDIQGCTGQAAPERQGLPCMRLAHPEQ